MKKSFNILINMKTKFLTLFLALVASIGIVFAQSGTCGNNLSWNLSNGVLTISGTGAMTNYEFGDCPWYSYHNSIISISIGNRVTSIGDMAFSWCSGLTSVTIPNSVTNIGKLAFFACTGLTSVTIGNGVTSIEEEAFSSCKSLTSITIPNSVTRITSTAFKNCPALTRIVVENGNIVYDNRNNCNAIIETATNTLVVTCKNSTIPNSVTSIGNRAFYGCSGLTSIEIPNSVTSIGDSVFYECTGLTSIEIPNSVTSIGSYAFSGCTGLTSIEIPNSITSIGISAFADCKGLMSVTIPNSVTSIGDYAFYNCKGLTSPVYNAHVFAYLPTSYSGAYSIPDGIESIAGWAFWNCSGLTSVTIPNSVTSIGNGAFADCKGLTSVTIGNSVTSIGNNAFSSCKGLTSVHISDIAAWCNIEFLTNASNPLFYAQHLYLNGQEITELTIPNSVTSIGSYAFYNCSGLTSVTIGNSVTSIGDKTFYNCTGLTSVTIGNNVTNIGTYAFSGCSGLTSVTIGNSVTSIGLGAFYNCTGLTSIEIPNSVTSIGRGAFYDCTGLTSVTIGNSVTSIEEVAFYDCTALTHVKLLCNTPPTLGNDVFLNANELSTICVLSTAIDAYKQAWSSYASKIVAMNTYTITTVSSNDEWGTTSDSQTAFYLDNISISATAKYGYHFTQWSDGNTSNPRIVTITEDKTYTATFAKNTYSITKNSEYGSITGRSSAEYLDNIKLTVTADYGYHFVQWSDGNIDNPRNFILTKDTTFTAEFAKNTYTITTSSANPTWGGTSGDGSALYQEQLEISATPNYGYTFAGWNDGNKDNPRTITITEDKSYQASFAKKSYSITKQANTTQGYISGPAQAEYMDNVTLKANPNYGYYFVQWSDGIIINPRSFVLTNDTSFTAEFAKNIYSIATASSNSEWGTTIGDSSALYLDELQISATPNFGYHFSRWNDGNTQNPRTVIVTEDKTYQAIFEKNIYSITKVVNTMQGSISGPSQAVYLDKVTLTAIPNYGYHFTQWNDGNTENPRTIIMTRDSTFTAEFAVDKSGVCGKDNRLQWSFLDDGTLTISGNGALTENYTFGVEAPTQMKTLIIGNEVTAIGERAFYAKSNIKHLEIGGNVTSIGDYAFAECKKFDDITCYAKDVPEITATTFENVGNKKYIYLYVLAECERAYKRDEYWSEFDIQIKGATTTTTSSDKATVEPTDNTVTVTWPMKDEAATYTIEITKDGEVFCRLIFNAAGQLTGIAFAPGRNGQTQAPAATMTTNGMQFTVTGLNSGTKYGYSLTAKNAANQAIASYSGSFQTTGSATAINQVSQQPIANSQKLIKDGQLLILRGDKTYTVTGQEVK